jgi:transposase
VDDWAWRKGCNSYGTILVDLEQGVVADLLPGRSAASFAKWLREHPGVKVISRDRDGVYADGGYAGAPAAKQVADRFHLIQNLSKAVEGELAHQRHHLLIPAQEFVGSNTTADAEVPEAESIAEGKRRDRRRNMRSDSDAGSSRCSCLKWSKACTRKG